MIKGLRPVLAEAGKIKIGRLGAPRPKRGGHGSFRLPTKIDHFWIVKTTRTDSGDFEPDKDLMALLDKDPDGKIREIPIVLHSSDIEEVFPTCRAWYGGRKLLCRGDGETATRWEVDAKGNRTDKTYKMQCGEGCKQHKERRCKPNGTLHCSIAVPGLAVAGSVHKWRTTSWNSIRRMYGSLEQILRTCGILQGLPLVLRLEPVQVTPEGEGSKTVYCCHVELRAKDLYGVQAKALELAQMRNALASGQGVGTPKMLLAPPAGDHETDREQADVQQEFFPEDEDDGEFVDTDFIDTDLDDAYDPAEPSATQARPEQHGPTSADRLFDKLSQDESMRAAALMAQIDQGIETATCKADLDAVIQLYKDSDASVLEPSFINSMKERFIAKHQEIKGAAKNGAL